LLTLIVAVPVITVALFALAYLNFTCFLEGWPLWRRNLLGLLGATVLVGPGSAAIYHRAWEVLEPAEPAHGAAQWSLANPPELRNETYNDLLVRLPDGRVWFDYLAERYMREGFWFDLARLLDPLSRSAGPQRFIAGSGWADASARHVAEQVETKSHDHVYLNGYAESVGIQSDGTLWASDKSDPNVWTADKLTQVGEDSNWRQLARGYGITSVLLLKTDGTLWRWGTNEFDLSQWPQKWPGLRAFQPYQIGSDTNWAGVYSLNGLLARKADGSVWRLLGHSNIGARDQLYRETNYDQIVTEHFSRNLGSSGAYVRDDGTLWSYGDVRSRHGAQWEFAVRQCGRETNWVAVACRWRWMVALKADGTLWQSTKDFDQRNGADFGAAATRLGIHHDWISVVDVADGVVSLAADGSLWLWPDPNIYNGTQVLLQIPKQPQFIANVFEGRRR
jgi:alpha-tubulin suppressor-like RCC1 family protein